jgi:hypothetical protein
MRAAHLTRNEAYRVMLTEDRKRAKRRRPPALTQSCPQGLTESDLQELFGDRLPEFDRWMFGQTSGLCDGRQFHYIRVHNRYCKTDHMPGTRWYEKAHAEGDDFTWRCGYDGGYYEPTECAANPHGMVTYRSDVERFLMGLPVIDLCADIQAPAGAMK